MQRSEMLWLHFTGSRIDARSFPAMPEISSPSIFPKTFSLTRCGCCAIDPFIAPVLPVRLVQQVQRQGAQGGTTQTHHHLSDMYPCCLPCTFPHSPKDQVKQVKFFPAFLNFTKCSSRNACDSKNGCLSYPLLRTDFRGAFDRMEAAPLKQPEDNYPPKLRGGNLAISKYTSIKIPLNPFWRLSLRMSKVYPTSECECPDHIT